MILLSLSLSVRSQTYRHTVGDSLVVVKVKMLNNALVINSRYHRCIEGSLVKDSAIQALRKAIDGYKKSSSALRAKCDYLGEINRLSGDSCLVKVEQVVYLKDLEIGKQKRHKWYAVGGAGSLLLILLILL